MKRYFFLFLLAACTAEEPAPQERLEPVVVYAAFEETSELDEILERYKEESGVLVILRRGKPDAIVDDVIANKISPPADILLTRSVFDAWRAAEESALRPIYSDVVTERLPDWARDPDGLWFATSADHAVIAHGGGLSGVTDVADLADDTYSGSLCLSSSTQAINRAVIAILIDALGARPAELVVRGWVKNLAHPPFATEAELVNAISRGTCAVGIVTNSAAEQGGISTIRPATRYAEIEAVGVARHARNPDGAARLVEYLVSGFGNPETGGKNVGLVAWHYQEAIKLAERARYP